VRPWAFVAELCVITGGYSHILSYKTVTGARAEGVIWGSLVSVRGPR
jgi:hypothetical protein